MEETGSIHTAIATPSAEAEGGAMTEIADADQASMIGDDAEMQQHTAEEPLPAVVAEAPSDRGSTQADQGQEEVPAATAEAADVPAEDQEIRTEAAWDEPAKPPPGTTEGTQPQAPSEETSEQPKAEAPSLATPEPEAAAAEESTPRELLDPVGDPELKPASLSSQSEESIRAYLDNTVVPVLRDGLRMLVKERPEDPCNYLVDYIKAHHP